MNEQSWQNIISDLNETSEYKYESPFDLLEDLRLLSQRMYKLVDTIETEERNVSAVTRKSVMSSLCRIISIAGHDIAVYNTNYPIPDRLADVRYVSSILQRIVDEKH